MENRSMKKTSNAELVENLFELYHEAEGKDKDTLERAIQIIGSRKFGDVKYANRAEALDSSISTLTALLHYHQRLCIVSDPNFIADTYSMALTTALECLTKEKNQISQNEKIKSAICSLESINRCLKNPDIPADDFLKHWESCNEAYPNAEEVARKVYSENIEYAINAFRKLL